MQTLFIVTHNIAGYMPEADPVAFETFADAKGYVITEMRQATDQVDPGTPDPWGEHYAESLVATAEELNLISDTHDGSYGTYVETGPDPTHLPQSWDITKTLVSDEEAAELMGEMA